jgi:hypothetical protein
MSETNNADNKINPGYFGHGVVGKDLHAKEQAAIKDGGDIFGPGVTGVGLPNQAVNKAGPGVVGAPAAPPPVAPMLSIKDLEEALNASPLLVDTFLAVELDRPGGPRKGALAALETAEHLRTDGPREDVLAQIAAASGAEPPEPETEETEEAEQSPPEG